MEQQDQDLDEEESVSSEAPDLEGTGIALFDSSDEDNDVSQTPGHGWSSDGGDSVNDSLPDLIGPPLPDLTIEEMSRSFTRVVLTSRSTLTPAPTLTPVPATVPVIDLAEFNHAFSISRLLSTQHQALVPNYNETMHLQ